MAGRPKGQPNIPLRQLGRRSRLSVLGSRFAAGTASSIRRPPEQQAEMTVSRADGPLQLIVLAAPPSGFLPVAMAARQAPDGSA
jgi:hypothetical protein